MLTNACCLMRICSFDHLLKKRSGGPATCSPTGADPTTRLK